MSIWRKLKFRRTAEAEMQEELRSLREIAGERELGNLTYAAEEARAVWRWMWLDNLWRDVRYAFRVLARQPSFTAVAILSLGLGIGANAAIFSLIDRVLWRQLPVREPERLVSFENSKSYFALQQFSAKSAEILEGVTGTTGSMQREISTGGEPRSGGVELVAGNFELLGVTPAIGRAITPEDDRRGQSPAVAVLGYDYWRSAYGGDYSALGRTIRVNNVPFTIVGVAPKEFFGVTVGEAADVWLPLSTLPQAFPGLKWLDSRQTNFMTMLGRLRPGITVERAASALTPLANAIDIERGGADMPEWIRKKIEMEKLRLNPASQGISWMRSRFSKPLRVLFAMVGIGLLLVCVNVMSLQFARADGRRRELMVRLAIGGSRGASCRSS